MPNKPLKLAIGSYILLGLEKKYEVFPPFFLINLIFSSSSSNASWQNSNFRKRLKNSETHTFTALA